MVADCDVDYKRNKFASGMDQSERPLFPATTTATSPYHLRT